MTEESEMKKRMPHIITHTVDVETDTVNSIWPLADVSEIGKRKNMENEEKNTGIPRDEKSAEADAESELPPCSNPHCTDGYVDKEFGTQDGRYSYVDQVPCQICNAEAEPSSQERVWTNAAHVADASVAGNQLHRHVSRELLISNIESFVDERVRAAAKLARSRCNCPNCPAKHQMITEAH